MVALVTHVAFVTWEIELQKISASAGQETNSWHLAVTCWPGGNRGGHRHASGWPAQSSVQGWASHMVAVLSICFNTCSGRFRLWSRATSARAGSLFCPLCPSSGEPGTCQRWQMCTSIILDAVVVLVHFSCCKELLQTMWFIDSGGLFSQCWRLGGSRPEHQQTWCVVRTYLLNLAQTSLCKFTQQKGKDDL